MTGSTLLGRREELSTVLAVCRAAASGRGSTLVVAGEPGIGKTALLAHAAAASSDWDAVKVTGVEAESEIAFATLQALLWPLRDQLNGLGTRQSALLRGILELGPPVETSAFAIGAAVLTLLSLASERRPLVLIVDDAHSADLPSQDVLCFVGRRLEHEQIALLASARTGQESLLAEESSFGRLELRGLAPGDAHALLERAAPGIAPRVADQLVEACAGNPLGLVELPLLLTEAQQRGQEPILASLEAGPLVQRAFAALVEGLDEDARHALLLLAAAGDAEPALLARAGVHTPVLDEIEAAGLVTRRAKVEFRHPLVRSAVYGAASPSARRSAHRALAEVTDGGRRAWHLADAADDPDESVAEDLEAAARDARLTGGVASEGQALERAAELTPGDERRATRMLAAARAWRRAGQLERAHSLLDHALQLAADVRSHSEIQLERCSMLVREGKTDLPSTLLLAEADIAAEREPKLAAALLVEAVNAAEAKGDIGSAITLAERACSLAGHDGDRAELAAINCLLSSRMAANAPPDERDVLLVSRAADLLQGSALREESEAANWIAYCLAAHERDAEARTLSDGVVAAARATGDVWSLCNASYARAALEQAAGRVDSARVWANEAVPVAVQIGEAWRIAEAYAVLAEVEAARGSLEDCRRAFESSPTVTPDLEWAPAEIDRSRGFGLAHLAAGRFGESIPYLETAVGYARAGHPRAWYHLVPLELAEALAGAGRARDAEALLTEDADDIERSPLVRPRAKLARVRALLAPEAKVDAAFEGALGLLERVPHHLERARVELCWGERLQSVGRRADAAVHLEHAIARFDGLGAVGWAERTRRALEAASGSARPAHPRRTDVLTPQELRIASHAAAGLRDREIAELLFLSPRTVHSHLWHAYRKLDVTNRTQLAGVLAADGIRPVTDSVAEPR